MNDRSSAAGASPRLRVAVIEDDVEIQGLIAHTLESAGFSVDAAGDASTARLLLGRDTHAVIVLDIDLPDVSEFDLLRELVRDAGAPVVVLTGRGGEIDRVVGLELGAEDYMVKPFFPRELVTRVRRAASRHRPSAPSRLEFGPLVIDLDRREASVHGRPAALTAREFELLAHLAASPGTTFGRDDLLAAVWNSSPQWQDPKTVAEHIRRLRQKIEPEPSAPRWIKTVGRLGYRFEG